MGISLRFFRPIFSRSPSSARMCNIITVKYITTSCYGLTVINSWLARLLRFYTHIYISPTEFHSQAPTTQAEARRKEKSNTVLERFTRESKQLGKRRPLMWTTSGRMADASSEQPCALLALMNGYIIRLIDLNDSFTPQTCVRHAPLPYVLSL